MVRAASVDRNGMKRGAWSEEEDEKLRACINRFGHPNWRLLPFVAGLKRCGKSCRLRWVNYLKPGVKRGNFTKDEENLIIQLHKNLPNKWAAIAAKFPGRTDNDIKNYWHAHIQKQRRNRNRNKAAINNKIQNDDDDDQSFDDSRTSSCITTDCQNSSSEVDVEVVFHQAEENMGAAAAAAAVSESNADSDYNAANLEEEFHGIMEMDDIMSLLFEQPSNCNFSDFLAEPAVGDEDFFNF